MANRSDPAVEAWMKALPPGVASAVRRARDIVLGADPRVTETMKWKVPTFQYRGNIASFTPGKQAVGLMFHEGANLPGRHPLLTGDGDHVRTMRFADLAAVEAGRAAIEAAVRAWCKWKDGN